MAVPPATSGIAMTVWKSTKPVRGQPAQPKQRTRPPAEARSKAAKTNADASAVAPDEKCAEIGDF